MVKPRSHVGCFAGQSFTNCGAILYCLRGNRACFAMFAYCQTIVCMQETICLPIGKHVKTVSIVPRLVPLRPSNNTFSYLKYTFDVQQNLSKCNVSVKFHTNYLVSIKNYTTFAVSSLKSYKLCLKKSQNKKTTSSRQLGTTRTRSTTKVAS